MSSKDIVVGNGAVDASIEDPPERVDIGQWYWLKKDKETRLACVVHIGSNYVKLQDPYKTSVRIHNREFWQRCTFEPNVDAIIEGKVSQAKANVERLLKEVHQLTSRLSVGVSPSISATSETHALAIRTGEDIKSYEKALVRAKEKELPDLFAALEEQNKAMATWMKAKVIPLRARSSGMKEIIDSIDERIFSVELYAGLIEEVRCVRKGKPAAFEEKVRLLQRRHYMDEECLAAYEVGGMDYRKISDFDKWLARRTNFDRILPFQRCLVAFRVRRHRKDRETVNLSDFIRVVEEEKLDRQTFLHLPSWRAARDGLRLRLVLAPLRQQAPMFVRGGVREKPQGVVSNRRGRASANLSWSQPVNNDNTHQSFGRCYSCGSTLGCAVDCDNAPWNWDKPTTTPMAYLVRLVRWIRSVGRYRTGEPTALMLHQLKWLRRYA